MDGIDTEIMDGTMKLKRNKKSIVFLRPDNHSTILQQAASNLFFQVLVLLAALFMYVSVFPIESLRIGSLVKVLGILLGLILVFDVLQPLLLRAVPVRAVNYLIQLLLTAMLLFGAEKIFYGFYLDHQLDIEDGLLTMGEKYLSLFNSYFETSFTLPPGQEGMTDFSFWFCFAAVMIVQFALTKLVCKREIAVLTPTLIFIAELVVGKTPGAFGILLWSAAWVVILAKSSPESGLEIRGLLLWAALFGCSVLLLRGAAERLILQAPTYKAVQRQIEDKVKALGTLNLWGYREIVSNDTPEYSDEPVLSVHASAMPQDALYLKAFTGSSYSNSGWTEDKVSFKMAGADYDIDEAARLLWMELGEDVVFQAQYGINQIAYTITYENPMGTRAMVPYFCLADQEEAVVNGDWGLKKSLFSRETSVTGPDCNEAVSSILITYLREYYSYHVDASTYKRNPWNWYNEYAYQEYCENKSTLPSIAVWADILRQQKETMDTSSLSSVYFNQAMPEQMEYLKKGHNSQVAKTNRARLDVAGKVQAYLQENFTYSWNLDAIEDGRDPVEYFLSTGKRGYCMHFASAGALLLRELGVPARYSAGYIVKPGTFLKDAGGGFTAEVMDRNAHSWVEIYLDNTGWVPVEMTPGYTSSYGKLPTDKELAVQREKEEQKKRQEETGGQDIGEQDTEAVAETESETETEPAVDTSEEQDSGQTETGPAHTPGGANSGGDDAGSQTAEKAGRRKPGIGLLALPVTAVLLWGILSIIRKLVREYHEKLNGKLRTRKYRGAVRLINRRIYKKLRRMGKLRGRNVTDAEYEQILIAAFPSIEVNAWENYMEIVKKAAFSEKAISGEEAGFCHRIYRTVLLDNHNT